MREFLLTAFCVLFAAGAARGDDAMLVLDASGSMWGPIAGKSKVEIARTAVRGLLDQIPADRRLGLIAYGHRREADCSDIEQVVPVGTDRAAIRKAVDALNFKGRTPLTAAVKLAAERLRYTEQKATVILVSDGIENCNLDPCVAGRELEAAGADLTVHVIGFGLANASEAAGLQCLAEATGGRYLGAADASALSAALELTVTAAPVVPPSTSPHFVLRATELDGGPEIASGLTWTLRRAGGAATIERDDAGTLDLVVPPGDYDITVVRAADGLHGAAKATARTGERTVTIPLEIALAASVAVSPAAAAPAGSAVKVQWTGPNRVGDFVTVVKTGAEPRAFTSYQDTARGNPAALELPAEAGDYEIRYVLGKPTRVLAAVPYKATGVTASVTAPGTGVAGASLEIAWTGPNYAGDWLTVVKPDADAAVYASYVDASGAKRALELAVEPGPYEIRYVQAGRKILARAPIEVLAATAELTAPAKVAIGADFPISWVGPNNRGDWLTVVPADAPPATYASYVDADHKGPATLRAAASAGRYEVRYVLKGKKVIAAVAIDVAR